MPDVVAARASVDVRCDGAAEFLELLDPLRGIFAKGTFIFRGVSSDTHGLLPSAHRDGTKLIGQSGSVPAPQRLLHHQCAAEFYTIDRFFAILARNGISVPEDSYVLREELEDWRARFQSDKAANLKGRTWPSPALFSLVALAQHHLVPTRALDWTYSAQVAAYFAAASALSNPHGRIAVWAIDDFTRQMDRILEIDAPRPLRVFTVSGAENENLRAQKGLFMLHPQMLDGSESALFEPHEYDQLLRHSLPVLKEAAQFIRVLAPESEASTVLALLARAGVTAAALHPGLAGAAREFREEQFVEGVEVGRMLWNMNTIGLWDRINDAAKRVG